MGLTDTVVRWSARAVHVLLVEVPGGWALRVAVEQQVAGRGWRAALSPADADALVVCGEPGPEMSEVIARVWDQMPGPRACARVTRDAGVAPALDTVREALLDRVRQRDDARARPARPSLEPVHPSEEQGAGAAHESHEDTERTGHEHPMSSHPDHGGMDHGGMDMAPAGIPLAEGGADRDGLEMDLLPLHLGPVLPAWPTGLVLDCALQGDVIVRAAARVLDSRGEALGIRPSRGPRAAAVRADAVARLLDLAGWDSGAARARRLRDLALADDGGVTDPSRLGDLAEDLERHLRRSRTLRWALRRVGPLTADDLRRQGLPGDLQGDVHDRLLAMAGRAREDLAPGPPGRRGHAGAARHGADAGDGRRALPAEALGPLVTGWDLATARLVIASLDLDPAPKPARTEVRHG